MAVKNFDIEIKNFDKNPAKDGDEPGKTLLMRNVIARALNTILDGAAVNGLRRAERGSLAIKIFDGGDIELTPEQMSLIKEAVGAVYPPLVVHQVYEYINA